MGTDRFYHITGDYVSTSKYVDIVSIRESSGKIILHVEDEVVEGEWAKRDGIFIFWFDTVDREVHEFTPTMRNGYLHLELWFTDDNTIMEFLLFEIKVDAFEQLFEQEVLMEEPEF